MNAIILDLDGYDTEKCAKLNDDLRTKGPQRPEDIILMTHALRYHVAQGADEITFALRCNELNLLIAGYDFSKSLDDDPYGERDMGWLDFMGERIMFKIDYYDLTREFGSENPADPAITSRVMTIMLASDY
jgi:hypothetical protein